MNIWSLDLKKTQREIYVISDLDNIMSAPAECFVIARKIQHALIHDICGTHLMAALHNLAPNTSYPNKIKPIIVDRIPANEELVTRAAMNIPRNMLAKEKTISCHAFSLFKDLTSKLLNCDRKAPKTRFNKKVTSHYTFNAVSFEPNEIKQLRKLVPDSIIKDIMVPIMSGAMQSCLNIKSELPSKQINVIPIAPSKTQGNPISLTLRSIHSDKMDHLEQLTAVDAENAAGKGRQKKNKDQLATDSVHLLTTTSTNVIINKAIKENTNDSVKSLFNTVISNIPISQTPLYHAGAKILAFMV